MGVPRGRQSAEPLWRAIAVFRFASLGYAVLLTAVINRADYARLGWAWVVIAAMTAWTVATTMAYARPERRTRLLLSADLAVTAGLLLSAPLALQYPPAMRHGVMPVTGIWVAGPVLAWAVQVRQAGGRDHRPDHVRLRLPAAAARTITVVLNGVVLLLLAGVLVGHLARLAAEVEAERQHAAAGRGGQPGTGAAGPRHPRLGAAGAGAGAAAGRRSGRRGRRTRPPGRAAGSRAAFPGGGALRRWPLRPRAMTWTCVPLVLPASRRSR